MHGYHPPLGPNTPFAGLIDQGEPSVLKLTEEVDAWLSPDATVQRLLERKDELTEGFTEYELRCKSWDGLRDSALNLQALKILVESGASRRKKLPSSGRPRVEYRWRFSGGSRLGKNRAGCDRCALSQTVL